VSRVGIWKEMKMCGRSRSIIQARIGEFSLQTAVHWLIYPIDIRTTSMDIFSMILLHTFVGVFSPIIWD
jgi:hypothetical protein